MMAQVLDVFCHAVNGNADGLYELALQTLQLIEHVVLSENNVRSLELKYFCPALDYALRNVPIEQAMNIATRYTAIRTELINRRLVTPDYLPSVNQF